MGFLASTVPLAILIVYFLPPQTVINYNLQQSTRPEVLFHGEGVANTVDIVRNDKGTTIMMVNGNIEADTSFTQRRHFILKEHLPLLLLRSPADVAMVGLGLGITLEAVTRNPDVRNIRVIELSPEMVRAHRLNPDISGNVLESHKVNLRIDDGRNFMTASNETFDMITADPIHPRISGGGYLYTREYYEAIKSRLRRGGVVIQWMPMYRISKRSFDVAFRTFFTVFPDASFWYVRGHGLFVSKTEPLAIDFKIFSTRFIQEDVLKDMNSIDINSPESLLGYMLMDSEHIARYLESAEEKTINTDDNAYLEYRTPFEFLEKTETIISALAPYAGWKVEKIVLGASEKEISLISQATRHRLKRLLPELSERLK